MSEINPEDIRNGILKNLQEASDAISKAKTSLANALELTCNFSYGYSPKTHASYYANNQLSEIKNVIEGYIRETEDLNLEYDFIPMETKQNG